ncbi:MAG: ATP-binding protein [Anaerolineae bacterium]|nr:ATP-binding protein [Anaerolineae bacterium]
MSVFNSTERQTNQLEILAEVAKTLTIPMDLPELLEAVINKITEVLDPANFGVVLLWDPFERLFRPLAAGGRDLHDLQTLRQLELREGEGIAGKVYAEGVARIFSSPADIAEMIADMLLANAPGWAQAYGLDKLPQSMVAVPLCASDHKFGVLMLGSLQGPAVFAQSDVPFIQTLADLIALAIDRALLEAEAIAIREEKQTDRFKAEAMAALSHELRISLATIKGYSTALLLEEISWSEEKHHEFLQLIDGECENLETMINDILDSSLIDAGQLILAHQPVRLERLASEVVGEMQPRSETHRLVIDFPPDFPLVDADPVRLRQVLRNIIDNSIKYSPKGGLVVIRGEIRPTDVVISVADQGVGLSPEDIIPLFDKYFRVKSAVGYHVPGTGLGLPVVRAVIEAHGGRVWAESKVGEGTTLYFSIPLQGLSAEMLNERIPDAL